MAGRELALTTLVVKEIQRSPHVYARSFATLGPFGSRGFPDIMVLRAGRAYFFELKRNAEPLQPIQALVLQSLASRGGAQVRVIRVADKLRKRGVIQEGGAKVPLARSVAAQILEIVFADEGKE